jgi:transposase
VAPNRAFPPRAHEEDRPLARQHRELILNYFRAQKLTSSGVVEGLNNKAKVTMRKSYGFRTYRVLELALYHSLGKLPEPVSTHDFF